MGLERYTAAAQTLLDAAAPQTRLLLVRVRAADLYPPFLAKLLVALETCRRDGRAFWITTGERTWDEQAKLYSYGRTDKTRGVVTTVGPGDSAHQYGIAADAALDIDPVKAGLQPSWDKKELQHWADAALAAGLDAGWYWRQFVDGPHVQLDIRKYKISPGKQLKSAFKKGGKLAVFEYLDGFSW